MFITFSILSFACLLCLSLFGTVYLLNEVRSKTTKFVIFSIVFVIRLYQSILWSSAVIYILGD